MRDRSSLHRRLASQRGGKHRKGRLSLSREEWMAEQTQHAIAAREVGSGRGS